MYVNIDTAISLQKAILWEQAKGMLRAIVAADGSRSSTTLNSDGFYPRESYPFERVQAAVDHFIAAFEGDGFHE